MSVNTKRTPTPEERKTDLVAPASAKPAFDDANSDIAQTQPVGAHLIAPDKGDTEQSDELVYRDDGIRCTWECACECTRDRVLPCAVARGDFRFGFGDACSKSRAALVLGRE